MRYVFAIIVNTGATKVISQRTNSPSSKPDPGVLVALCFCFSCHVNLSIG